MLDGMLRIPAKSTQPHALPQATTAGLAARPIAESERSLGILCRLTKDQVDKHNYRCKCTCQHNRQLWRVIPCSRWVQKPRSA
jgi:hypothetical protein